MVTVYIYWDKGVDKLPPMIDFIYQHNLKVAKKYGFNITLVSDQNITQFIDPPDRFWKLAPNFKSDIVRFWILNKYGGIWLDTDILILRDINLEYQNFLGSNTEAALDIEYSKGDIGSCSIYMKGGSTASLFCQKYVDQYLSSEKALYWGEIGPGTVNKLVKEKPELVRLRKWSPTGVNFITWNVNPGFIKHQWIKNTESDAFNTAKQIIKEAPYVVTWTIYRKNNIEDSLVDFVFRNPKSVLTHLVNYNWNTRYLDPANTIKIFKPIVKGNTVSCRINYKGKEIVLSNEYQADFPIDLSSCSEGFVALMIPKAILEGAEIWVEYAISKSFYDNVQELVPYYSQKLKKNLKLSLNALIKEDLPSSNQGVISTFTGGVDSFYTLSKRIKEIDTLIYTINYDLQEKTQGRILKLQLEIVKEVAKKLNKKVIICTSNQRNVLEPIYLKPELKHQFNNDMWGYFLHGVCLFSNFYNLMYHKVYVPSTHPSSDNQMWGTSFHTDHLYSSNRLQIIHDGDITRTLKIKYMLSSPHCQHFLDHLKVCYCNGNSYLNCSQCGKCLHTIIPIGIFDRTALKNLKTFTINPAHYDNILNNFLRQKFTDHNHTKHQNEIRRLINIKSKKFGVIDAYTVNIGDTVQTLAAVNLLKKAGITDYQILDREALDSYHGEEIYVIMNGWFMHDLRKFPPSPKIKPIFISFHCQHEPLIKNNQEYFRKHQPIGCRDTNTVKLFQKYGIEAYFSGCLTLTFDPNEDKGEEVIVCDVNSSCNYIPRVNINLRDVAGSNYQVIEHDIKDKVLQNSFLKRIEYASQILDRYRKAKLVVTTRLHCALPSRAFGTPVHFIHQDLDTDTRFTGLKHILHGEDFSETRHRLIELGISLIHKS